MKTNQPRRFRTISEFHQFRGLPRPEHPLISVINVASITHLHPDEPMSLVADFYFIAAKRIVNASVKYGQHDFDGDEGIMSFMSPGQVFSVGLSDGKMLNQSGWVLLIHPDFLWHTPLAKTIQQYEYFSYAIHEGLYLSPKEEAIIVGIISTIEQEYLANIDTFSQPVIIAQLELLLTYADRFYQRQFITRKIDNHRILNRLETMLTDYFNSDALAEKGIPAVQYVSDALNISPNYLSTLLKLLTGRSTQQHIHDKLIEKAKEKLSVTDLSISEIAYELGFEHSQSFSKLFKQKTSLTPLSFRQSFN